MLDIVLQKADDVKHAARYQLESQAKLKIPNIADIGNLYQIEAKVGREEDWQTFQWRTVLCPGTPTTEATTRTPVPDPSANADGVVTVDQDGLAFGRNQCDAIMVSDRNAELAAEYRLQDFCSK